MIKGLFGNATLSYALRAGLEEATQTHKAIAARVAGALESSSSTDFAGDFAAAKGKKRVEEADLQRDMAELADTQLRFEADAKLLQQAYGRLRTAIRDNRG
jgi:flagellar basal body rod protein FlgB